MEDSYSGCEIVDIAIQMEKNGHDFYSSFAQKAKEQAAKVIFNFLAEEESKHAEVFKKILFGLKNRGNTGIFNEEYFDYMNALAKKHVFKDKDKVLTFVKNTVTDKDAVDMGIKAVEEDMRCT